MPSFHVMKNLLMKLTYKFYANFVQLMKVKKMVENKIKLWHPNYQFLNLEDLIYS